MTATTTSRLHTRHGRSRCFQGVHLELARFFDRQWPTGGFGYSEYGKEWRLLPLTVEVRDDPPPRACGCLAAAVWGAA